MNYRHELGRNGEEFLHRYLKEREFEILARNFRIWREVEIDIVAKKDKNIFLIEVKTHFLGTFPAIISPKQLQRLRKAAFQSAQKWRDFDVHIVIAWVNPKDKTVEFLKDPL